MDPDEATRRGFCTSCGAPYKSGIPACSCGVGKVERAPDLVGSLVTTRVGMRKTTATVLAASQEAVSFLTLTGRRFTRPIDPNALSIELDLSAIPSTSYRFHTLADLPEWQSVIPAELCRPGENGGGRVEARLFARSAIAAGKVDLARSVGVSKTEIDWLLMRAFRHQGALSEAAKHALLLPPDRYPDHLVVLTEAVTRSAVSPDAVLNHFGTSAPDPLSIVLRHICGETSRPGTLRAALTALGYSEPNERSDLGYVAVALRKDVGLDRLSADKQRLLATVPGVLPYLLDRHAEWFTPYDESPPLVRVALTPGEASEEDLVENGHVAELARRWFLTGRDQNLARLSDSDPAVLHYRALLALSKRDTSQTGALRPDPISEAVARSLDGGHLDATLETDPTVWGTVEHLDGWQHITPSGPAGARLHLRRSLASLFEWSWSDAAKSARAALQATDLENLRDEALNLLGFALYQLGQAEAAVAAVEKALEDHYSANLQINIGVLAQELAPNVAAEHLVRLAEEAPSLDLRLAAARRALTMWDPEQQAWETTSDSELPPKLRDLFRSLAVASTDPTDHLWVMRMLAHWDQDWVANEKNTNTSPNVRHPEHTVLVGRSKGPAEYISALTSALNSPTCPHWVVAERDGFLDNLTQMVFDANGNIGPSVWAFEAVDQGLPMETRQRVVLSTAAVFAICRHLLEKGQGPSDKVKSMALRTRHDFERSLGEEDRRDLRVLVDMAMNSCAIAAAEGSRAQFNEALSALIQIEVKVIGVHRRSINWSAVYQATKPIVEFLTETIQDLGQAADMAADPEIRSDIRELIVGVTTVRDDATRLGR